MNAEAVLLQRLAQPLHPGHLAHALLQFDIAHLLQLDAVAAILLGHVASDVDAAQRLLNRHRGVGEPDNANADADVEGAAVPHEMQLLHRLAQGFRRGRGKLRRAVLHQDAELVAAQPGQHVARPQLLAQRRRNLAQ